MSDAIREARRALASLSEHNQRLSMHLANKDEIIDNMSSSLGKSGIFFSKVKSLHDKSLEGSISAEDLILELGKCLDSTSDNPIRSGGNRNG